MRPHSKARHSDSRLRAAAENGAPADPIRRTATFLHLCRRFQRDEEGAYLVITGIVMAALAGMVGLGTEAGVWFLKHRTIQSAADSAALSAATAYYVQGAGANFATQAKAVAASYGLVDGVDNVTVTTNVPPLSGSHTTTPRAVEVIVSQSQTRLFSALYGSGPVVISSRSVAKGFAGKGCVVSLDPSLSGATNIGTGQVQLNECSLYDNSSNSSALTVGGSGTMSAQSVNVVGGISGGTSITTTDGIYTGQRPIDDPYLDATYPSFSGCTYSNKQNINSNTTFSSPANAPTIFCGDVVINAGATVTLNPGIYYFDRSSLSVTGGGALNGSGVTLVFTSSNGHYPNNYNPVSINGGASINLTAPTSGPTAGIVIFGDRLMTAGAKFTLNGGSTEVFRGAIYVPRGDVSFAGGAASENGCLQLVANTIKFDGSSKFAVNCVGAGTRPIGSAFAQLVE